MPFNCLHTKETNTNWLKLHIEVSDIQNHLFMYSGVCTVISHQWPWIVQTPFITSGTSTFWWRSVVLRVMVWWLPAIELKTQEFGSVAVANSTVASQWERGILYFARVKASLYDAVTLRPVASVYSCSDSCCRCFCSSFSDVVLKSLAFCLNWMIETPCDYV